MAGSRPKKRFSQVFLADKNIARKIVDLLDLQPDDTVFEIGSGRGTLTEIIAYSGARLFSFEIDRDLMENLAHKFSSREKVEIIRKDFLKAEPADYFGGSFKLIGNIPYDITSPILDWMIKYRAKIERAVITTQKELGERIAATPGGKNWAPVSIFCQCHFEITQSLTISPQAFYPRPKVVSTTLVFKPDHHYHVENEELFETVVRQAFKQRRKKLVNNLAGLPFLDKETAGGITSMLGLDENIRAEDIDIETFIRLVDRISKGKSG